MDGIRLQPFLEQKSPLSKSLYSFSRQAKKIGAFAKAVLLFPARFFGSKELSLFDRIVLWLRPERASQPRFQLKNSYQRSYRDICPAEARSYLPYMIGIRNFHSRGGSGDISLDVQSLPGNIRADGPFLTDETTGLYVKLLRTENEISVIFSTFPSEEGQEDHFFPKTQMILQQMLGGEPKAFKQAHAIVHAVQQQAKKEGLLVTAVGACRCGPLASYAALQTGVRGVTLNSLGMGPGLQKKLGVAKVLKNQVNLRNLCVQGDYIADNRLVRIFDRLLSALHFRTAAVFGNGPVDRIPTIYPSNPFQSHGRPMRSFFAYVRPNDKF